jgi:hypothetical protein
MDSQSTIVPAARLTAHAVVSTERTTSGHGRKRARHLKLPAGVRDRVTTGCVPVVLSATAALLVAGCGARSSDAAEIRDVVHQFGLSIAEGRAERACAAVTEALAGEIVERNADLRLHSCAEVVRAAGQLATERQRRELRALTAESVEVHADRATAQLHAASVLVGNGQLRLRKIHGRWLIAGAP